MKAFHAGKFEIGRLGCKVFFLLSGLLAGLFFSAPIQASDYLVGPQDKLNIEVVEWRANTASIFEWSPLTGEFTVSTSGNLTLPILGSLPVAEKTVEQISAQISEGLQKIVGLQKPPSASVEVSEYRPFFVGGLVSKPGKYDYFPGLTVLQALSIAGGYARPVDRDAMGIQREVLSSRGTLRQLQAERLSLLARNARLEAVIRGEPEISFPEEITSQSHKPEIRQILKEEQQIFTATQKAMEAEINSLSRNMSYAADHTEVLKSKQETLEKQATLADDELGKISGLVSKGLTVSTRQFGAEQFVSELQTRQLDVAMALITTQQAVAMAEYKIEDVQEKYRLEAQIQQTEVRDRLTSVAAGIQTTRALIQNIELYAPEAAASAGFDTGTEFTMMIIRNVNGEIQRFSVDELSTVLPGDVVQVERKDDG
ncbi:polysaccharide biosynthesis/export family protein [Roseibium marinum]|uniref:Polysaccharide export outer membrane protein n=1 Tax=Roseibium marinum TaxID=281252 RepID=A0A2S3UTP5_9HYPH|nr:polysaccharide biosynthesis/export family protein [Roseibium marinum]POF31081.1 polysaccharide export outer membrane protein [Roseibium marinum]